MTFSTFDIFDTVLTRRVCDPNTVFLFVGADAKRLNYIPFEPSIFKNMRIQAETMARINSASGEVTLNDIYSILERVTPVGKATADAIMSLELIWEERLIVPVAKISELIATSRKSGRRIAFVSDMYLPSTFLRSMLEKYNLIEASDDIWVSCEHGVSKQHGDLYRLVGSDSKLTAQEHTHHGNNLYSDITMALQSGWRATFLPDANPTHYEELLEKHSSATAGLASLLAGAARMTRLERSQDAPNSEIARFSSNILCPVLTSYALWVLTEANRLGIERLYFVSRDGYSPWLIAKHLAAQLFPKIKCRYFFGSRRAWHLAAFSAGNTELIGWLLEHGDGLDASSLMKRLDLTWEEAVRIAPTLRNLLPTSISLVDEEARNEIIHLIRSNTAFSLEVTARARERNDVLRSYARQEGLFDPTNFGIVDVGWFGRTRKSLERALPDMQPPHWFYIALDRKVVLDSPERVSYFIAGPRLPRREILSMPEVVECLCLAPHGSVLAYKKEQSKIVAIFDEGIEKALHAWGRDEVFITINSFLDTLDASILSLDGVCGLANMVQELLEKVCLEPTRADAHTLGTIPFQQDHASDHISPLAPPARLTIRALLDALRYGSVQRAAMNGKVGVWGAGAWALRRSSLRVVSIAAFAGRIRLRVGPNVRTRLAPLSRTSITPEPSP